MPNCLYDTKKDEAIKYYLAGLPVTDIAREIHVSKGTIYNIISAWEQEHADCFVQGRTIKNGLLSTAKQKPRKPKSQILDRKSVV